MDEQAVNAYDSAVRNYEAGNYGTAERICIGLLQADGRHAEALHLLALVNLKAKRLDDAEKLLSLALGLKKSAHYLSHLGVVLSEQGRVEDSLDAFRDALALKPESAETLSNMGVALQKQGRLAASAEAYRKALVLRPDFPEASVNLVKVLLQLARMDEAIVALRQALKRDPYHAETRFMLGLALLTDGHLLPGWDEYEWRWQTDELRPARPTFTQPLWSGEPAEGRTILLCGEQGLGDTIQFVRYVPMVLRRGFRVMLEAPRALVALLRAAYPNLKIMEGGGPLPRFDVYCPLPSLPRALATTLDTIPAPIPYLKPDPARVAQWRARLPRAGFTIGVVWQGTPNREIDRGRSFPLAALAPLAQRPGVRLISLQKTHGLDQLDGLPEGMRVETLGADFDAGPDAFLDTAAIVMSLDLVITSDTSVAHVVGALGRPGWLLLKRIPDWRWMLDRDDTPWYPSLRLFRQSEPGDWAGVVDRAVAALDGLMRGAPEVEAVRRPEPSGPGRG